MNILITGANGNLGSSIVDHASSHIFEKVCRNDWDKLDDKLSNSNIVIHAAGDIKSSITSSPVKIIDSNLITTMRLLEGCLRQKIEHFYYVSSCSVYGDVSHTNESQICQPISLNGDIKKLNESIISSFCKANKIGFTIFRVFNTFGGNDKFSIVSKLLNEARTNGAFILNNNGLSQRDFIHVDDIANIILQTLELNEKPEYLNVGTGKTHKIIELYNIVKQKFPDLNTKYTSFTEVEYSRADTRALMQLTPTDFISVLDYLQNEIM